jgi:tRNA-specific 2-thiouridylase
MNLTTGNNSAIRVLVAMSGGVDSSVAALLLQRQGYDCTGAMMKLYDTQSEGVLSTNRPSSSRGCCTLEDAEDARAVANRLGLPFFVFNFMTEFEERVLMRFAAAYRLGVTPNPCIDCNRFVKFDKFIHRMAETDHDFIATGHYSRIEKTADGRYLLKKGRDESKDQSYVLYAMTQKQLSRTLFPLGDMTKSEVRAIAEAAGLVNAKKRDSQDICFAPDGDYAGFIERYENRTDPAPNQPGNFVTTDGTVLGKHRGLIHYTIGQRKGLGISAPQPLYVTALDVKNNAVILGKSEELFSHTLTANDINLIPFDTLPAPLRVTAKIRYSHIPQPAVVHQTNNDELYITFDQPQRAITPGQAVVLYEGDTVIGGGTITLKE